MTSKSTLSNKLRRKPKTSKIVDALLKDQLERSQQEDVMDNSGTSFASAEDALLKGDTSTRSNAAFNSSMNMSMSTNMNDSSAGERISADKSKEKSSIVLSAPNFDRRTSTENFLDGIAIVAPSQVSTVENLMNIR